jgi:hypothetical protein
MLKTLLLIGILAQDSTIFDRYAHVLINGKHNGSAVHIRNGKFVTATHVISDSSGIELVFNDSVVSARLVESVGEVSILESDIVFSGSVSFGEISLGDRVYWIQPTQVDNGFRLFMMSAMVSRVENNGFFTDKAMFPGSSGSGVFNEKGELAGIVIGHIRLNQVPFIGGVLKIPKRLR